MRLYQQSSKGRARSGAGGMTLTEMMVAVGVGSVVLMVVCAIFVTSNRSFADMASYVSMNQASQEALAQMTRDIRKSRKLISFGTNRIELDFVGTSHLIFTYDPQKRQLIRSIQSPTGEIDTCLLSGCDSLEFSMYKNAPLAGGTFGQTSDPSLGKSIRVSWKCSRTILGQRLDSENVEQSLIVIRNQPVL